MMDQNSRQPIHFFTIVARNYLAQAYVLGESVLRYHPEAVFSICLIDDRTKSLREIIEKRGFLVVYPDSIPVPKFCKLSFQYNVTELSTAIKPFVCQWLFAQNFQKVIYLDPDIECFRRFDEVLAALKSSSIVLTPHVCSPVPPERFPDDKAIMRTGVFNLGFLGLANTLTTVSFLKWWADHLSYECVAELDEGLFVDQKWIDLVPSIFEGVFILKNTAYNIAYWNLHERVLEERNGVLFEKNTGEQVAFIHFSGVDVADLNSISKYVPRNPLTRVSPIVRYTLDNRKDLATSFERYRQHLVDSGFCQMTEFGYGFSTYENGQPISQLERSLYLHSRNWQIKSDNPFATGAGSFVEHCRNVGIKPVRAKQKMKRDEITQRYKLPMRVIRFGLKILLRVVGAQRYVDFAKFIRHQLLLSNQTFLIEPEGNGSLEPDPGPRHSAHNIPSRTWDTHEAGIPKSAS